MTQADETKARGAWGEPIDCLRHELIVEVEGATHTELEVKPEPGGRRVARCVVAV